VEENNWMLQVLELLLWPVTLLIIILLLRQPLIKLIPKTKKLKYKEFEWDIETGLNEASQQANKALPDAAHSVRESLYLLAEHSPNAAILQAWEEVVYSAENMLKRLQIEVEPGDEAQPYKELEELLLNEHLYDVKIKKLFSDLRNLRNKVAHAADYKTTHSEALRYIELCLKLLMFFDSLQEVREENIS